MINYIVFKKNHQDNDITELLQTKCGDNDLLFTVDLCTASCNNVYANPKRYSGFLHGAGERAEGELNADKEYNHSTPQQSD